MGDDPTGNVCNMMEPADEMLADNKIIIIVVASQVA